MAALALGGALPVLLGDGLAAADPSPLPPQVIYNYGELETARSAAMGGALRALGNGTAGLFLNPAAMAETRVYHLEGLAQFTPETARQVYGGAVIDSVTSRLAGGLAVAGGFMDPSGIDRSLIDVRLGLGFPVSDRFFVGVVGRYVKVTQEGLGPLGESKVSGGLIDSSGSRSAFVNAVTFDAGMGVKLGDNVYLAAVGQNLTYPDNSIVPTTVGGALGFGNENLSIEADGVADLTSWNKPTARLMAGGEYLVANHVPVRLGYRYDQGAKLNFLSGGVGYVGTEFSIEAAVRRSLSNPGTTTLVFSVAYFLESSGLTKTTTPDIE
jgi:opacity protein-like surface antigen